MIGLDIDGTAMNYGAKVGGVAKVNDAFLATLWDNTVDLITNQGGLFVDDSPDRWWRNPADFVARLSVLLDALRGYGVTVRSLRVCVFHQNRTKPVIEGVGVALAAELAKVLPDLWVAIYTDGQYRKPSPNMLKEAGTTTYYGDADEDEEAALLAGARFVKVKRFY